MVATGARPAALLVGPAAAAARRSLPRGWWVAVALAVLLVAVPAASGQGQSGRRLALVVGNDAYTELSVLQNAVNDARTVAVALEEVGFTVTRVENATRPRLAAALGRFAARLRGDDVALFDFAGHGVQVDGTNYLIPTDYAGQTAAEVRLSAFSAAEVEDLLRQRVPGLCGVPGDGGVGRGRSSDGPVRGDLGGVSCVRVGDGGHGRRSLAGP